MPKIRIKKAERPSRLFYFWKNKMRFFRIITTFFCASRDRISAIPAIYGESTLDIPHLPFTLRSFLFGRQMGLGDGGGIPL